MNQPKYSIEVMSEADWQQMPESGKRLIEMLVARIEQLERQYAELKAGDRQLLLAKFIAAFGKLGLIGEEIADVIWLALEIQQYEQLSPTKDSPGESKAEKSDNSSGSSIDSNIPIDPSTPSATSPTPSPSDLPRQSTTSPTPSPSDSPRQVEIYASKEQPGKKSANASRDLAIRLPDARSLQEPLTLARALRPLLRRVPSANMVLDEAATIERIAEEQLWTLVLKPDLEPWLDLALVVDESQSMLLWQPTIRELHRLLERYGIFRDVRTWGMMIDKNGQVCIRPGIGKAARNQQTRSPRELIDPQGRRLVLIATDCVASHWHDGTVLSALKTWSQSGSTAIIQMLPEWLWSRTALGLAAPVRFQALLPGLPSQRLKAKPLSAWDEIDFETGIQVPLVTLEPEIFTVWSQLVAGKGGVWAPGFVFEPELFEPDEEEENGSDNDLSAEQRVRQFYNSASPMAWKLACLLAAAPIINLPVVRIIQNELLHNRSRQVHVAEVFLGGLLSPSQPLSEITPDTNPDTIRYDFVKGVREALLESSLRSDSVDVLKVVSQFVDSRIGHSLEDFVAYLRDLDRMRDVEIQSSPIATVTIQILKQLGGEYARYAEQLEGMNESSTAKVLRSTRTQTTADNPTLGAFTIQGDSSVVTSLQTEILQISPEKIATREFIRTSPYKGLKRFEPEDKNLFFGRDQFLTCLVNELEQTNFILLLGASGSGKSSVIRAGLIPWLLRQWGSRFVHLTFTPDVDPFDSLYASLLSKFPRKEAQIALEAKADTVTQVVTKLKQSDSFWFIFIDQFEELFTITLPEKRDQFINTLMKFSQTKKNSVKIMATMRADFLDRLSPYPQLVKATDKHRPLITEMQPDELRLAIEQPAAQHGVIFETGLVEEIIKNVQGQAGYLPLLQYTLNLLWETEVQTGSIYDRTLNINTYRYLGGVRGVLQQLVDGIYNTLLETEKLAAKRIFLKLVGITGNSESDTEWKPVLKRALRSEFSDYLEQSLLVKLIDENLLVSDRPLQFQESTVEIAHEMLLTAWTTLNDWIKENRQAIALRNRLYEDVALWQANKREDELWAGSKLEQVVELRNDATFNQVLGGFNETASQFIDASLRKKKWFRNWFS